MKKTVSSSIKKLKLLVTVVNRSKAIYYLDLLEQFEINMQTVIYGRGTADKELFSLLKIDENEKAIILSVVKEEKTSDVLETLTEKFDKIKNGKGIAFTIIGLFLLGFRAFLFASTSDFILFNSYCVSAKICMLLLPIACIKGLRLSFCKCF